MEIRMESKKASVLNGLEQFAMRHLLGLSVHET